MGLVFIPLNISAFATLDGPLRTDASSLLNLTRSLGGSIGISLTTAIWGGNVQTMHQELGGHLTFEAIEFVDLSTLDRYQSIGQGALSMLNAELNRQASMVAYIDNFYLMMWMCIAAIPLCLAMRKNSSPVRP